MVGSARVRAGRAAFALLVVMAALLCLACFARADVEEAHGADAAGVQAGRIPPAAAGARLRAGIEAMEAGQAEQAAELFAAVAREHPIVADHAERLQLRALLALSQYAAALELASTFESTYPDSPLQGEVLQLLGDAHAARGDPLAARAAWRAARSKVRNPEVRASLDLSTAASFEGSGMTGEAARAYLSLWSDAPTSRAAGAAEEALERLEARGGSSLRTAVEFAKRARAFYSARANQEALSCYDRALAGSLPDEMRRELQRERGFTLFRLRRYPDAVAAFGELGTEGDARFWRARSLARSGRVDQAVQEFDSLAKGRFNVLAARSLFLAGTLLEDEPDGTRAVSRYARVASKAPTLGLRTAARWRLGWGAYREGRYREALEHFEILMKAIPDSLDQLSARYWRARALEKLGAAEAADEFRALATEYPLAYYGWRAAGRVDESSLVRDPPARRAPSQLSFAEPTLQRIAILIEAGLREEAQTETRILAAKARSLDDRLEIAHLSSAMEDYHRAQRVVVDPYAERLARGPEPGQEALWWFAWPTAFGELVETAARERHVAPALLNAVMREESGFSPEALSTVGARGLTQIMPETGARLAGSVGLSDFTADDLFRPARNLLLGAHYLEQLLARFDGRLPAVVASYNAGPEVVTRWLEAHPDMEDDEWVEAIPYDQTRQYVKRVLLSQQVYRVLY